MRKRHASQYANFGSLLQKKTASLSFRMTGKKGLLNDYVSIAQKVNGQ